MEKLILTGGGEHWLAFARSKIRGIRNSALKYGSQQYVMPDDAEVKVRVIGDVDEIKISGSSRWDYLVWPTSELFPRGREATLHGPVVAAMTLNKSEPKVKENVDLLAARHDWISYDGERDGVKQYGKLSLSYNCGADMRTHLPGAYQPLSADPFIYRNGKKLDIGKPVHGAAIRQNGGRARIIFASYEFDYGPLVGLIAAATKIVLYSVEKGPDGFVAEEFAQYETPPLVCIGHPSYFDGTGSKMWTVLETIHLEDAGGGPPLVSYGNPRFALRVEISENDGGKLSAQFSKSPLTLNDTSVSFSFTSPLGTSPSTPPGFFSDIAVSLPSQYNTLVGTGSARLDSHFFPGNFEDVMTSYISSNGFSGNAAGTTKTYKFLGIDMTADGEELIVEQEQDRTQNTTRSFDAKTESAGTPKYWDDILFQNHIIMKTVRIEQRSGALVIKTSLLVNNAPFYTATTTLTDVIIVETNTILSDIDYGGSGQNTATNPPPATSTTFINNLIDLSIRDMDPRYKAVAVVEGLRHAGIPPDEGVTAFPYMARMVLKFDGREYSKEFYNGVVHAQPLYSIDHFSAYRVFASRRPGEFVASFSPSTATHGAVGMEGEYLSQMIKWGDPDFDTLFVLHRKGVEMIPNSKFKIGGGERFRLDPVNTL